MRDVTTQLPLVSIITPSFNQGQFIEETVLSVLSQDYPHIEYIVMDGGSTDDTLEILKKYESRLTLISEKDKGQSDAINKGFRMARGEIVAWLNSDDTYLPGAVGKAVNYMMCHEDVAMVYGEGYIIDQKGNRVRRFEATQPFHLETLIEVWDYILQPTVFMRRNILEKAGSLNPDLHWCMDWDLWIRLGKSFRVDYISDYLANSRVYESTKTSMGGLRRFQEIVRIMRRHGEKRYALGYFIYGQDTLETLTKERWPRLYRMGLRKIHSYLRRYINSRRLKLCQGI